LVGTSLGKSFNSANAGKCPLHKARSSPEKHKNLWIHQSILSHLQQQKKIVVEKRTNVPSFATLKGKLCKQEKKCDLFFQHRYSLRLWVPLISRSKKGAGHQ
jgi:hypothetical protein